ncbi:hypothetical protein B7463_g5594, partial [Scytalidium lignicola]
MSTTPTQQPSPPSKEVSKTQLIHNVSLAAAILCPIIILLPPRKLDSYTILLMSGTFIGCNQLTYEYTGRSILTRVQSTIESTSVGPGSDLPEKAKQTQVRLREEKAAMLRQQAGLSQTEQGQDNSAVLEALRMQEEEKKRTLLQRLWMGSEGPDWKQKRDEKEKKALEEGKGYGDLITEQIWDVWNWGKTEDEGDKEAGEKEGEKSKKK